MDFTNINRLEDESNKIYNYRKQFIINNMEKLIKEGHDKNAIIKYSKILANIKFKGCKYNAENIIQFL